MFVYFENSLGQRRLIAETATTQETSSAIQSFLKDHNYTSYYSRSWKNEKGETVVDVGSHTEFFYIVGD